MGYRCSRWPGGRVFPGEGQGGVSLPSGIGSGSPPQPSTYPSGRGWAPVQTRADNNVSVWRTLLRVPPLPWKDPYTPWYPLLTPLLASGNLPQGTGRRVSGAPLLCFDCGKGYGSRPHAYQSTGWNMVTSRGVEGGVSDWGWPVPGSWGS